MVMDIEDLIPKRRQDPLDLVRGQDLDPLSVAELEARIDGLHAEIERTRAKLRTAGSVKSAADALFRGA